MAVVKQTASQAWREGVVDVEKVKATTEAEIAGYMIEDGEDPEDPLAGYRNSTPAPRTPRPKRSAARRKA